MVPRRKNLHVLASAVKEQHPTWHNMSCITEAKRLWDNMYAQQKQIAQVRANRLKKPFMLTSNLAGGVDVDPSEKLLDEETTIYLIVNPEFKKPGYTYA